MADEKQKEVLELLVPTTLKGLVEALVFAAREPLTVKQIKTIYEGDGPQAFMRQLDAEEVEAAVGELNAEYEKAEKPYRIIRIAGGFQFATIASYAEWIGRLYKEQGRRKLSQSGVETLAIVAYKQPVTKADIESIRGVNCDYVLGTLLEKELVTVVGRAHAPGRPLLYGTTREFLKHFGLNEITDLPRPREIEEILGESQFETERRMLEAQAGAETMKEEVQDFKSRLPHIPRKKPELETPVEIKPKDGQRTIKTVQQLELQSEEKPVPEVPVAPTEGVAEPPIPVIEPPVDVAPPEVIETTAEMTAEPAPSLSVIPPATQHEPEPVQLVPEVVDSPAEAAIPGEAEPTAVAGAEIGETLVAPPPDIRPEAPAELAPAPGQEPVPEPYVVHKSKWQSWKEKVQGFIRKIFG